MLILSRKINEKIMIGDDVSVSILEIRGDQVRLGVEAPKTVKVFRQEVFDAIRAENQAAAASLPPSGPTSGFKWAVSD
jgi:carbon storage regulator